MKYTISLILLLPFLSCNENSAVLEPTSSIDSLPMDQLKIVNKTDPICDMDVKEHVSDTALISGEIWGFCSSVCKEKFIQSKK